MKNIFIIALIFGLGACTKASDQEGSWGDPEEYCKDRPPVSDIEGSWIYKSQVGLMDEYLTFSFSTQSQPNRVNTEKNCIFKDKDKNVLGRIDLRVRSQINFDAQKIEILDDDYDDARKDDMYCSLRLERGPIQYRFQDGCLVLESAGKPSLYLLQR